MAKTTRKTRRESRGATTLKIAFELVDSLIHLGDSIVDVLIALEGELGEVDEASELPGIVEELRVMRTRAGAALGYPDCVEALALREQA